MKRRNVLKQGTALAALALSGTAVAAKATKEKSVEIPTPEGSCTTFIAYPDRGGPHPAVIMFMDAAGIREELRDMARLLAGAGFFVLLPNMYYRSHVLDLGPADVNQDSVWFKTAMSYQALLTVPRVMSDVDALLAYIATQKAAKPGGMGCMGFCMSGQYVIYAAARHPERITAGASIFGTGLVTGKPDSPDKALSTVKAALYFGFAGDDKFVPPAVVDTVKEEMQSRPNAEVEIYPGVQHGFAFKSRYSYDAAASQHMWQRVTQFFTQRLG